jgi:2-polyprenyl-3-methyl-5-hydroxy-6-metoxy-1,4-benzoquinol methylase
LTTSSISRETGLIAPPAYLYDLAWRGEQARLRALEELFDPASRYFIERLGIAAGWRCLEVGFGAGSLAVWLADRVAPTGRVLATDLDPRMLDNERRANLEVRRHDVVADQLPRDEFDVVHSRAVLAHIPERQSVLERLRDAVRPGGWLVVEDIDLAGPAMRAAAERYVWPPAARPAYRAGVQALEVVLSEADRDPGYGALLPAAVRDLGVLDFGAELHSPIIAGGAEQDCMRLTLEYLRARLLATRLVDESGFDQFLQLTRDGGVLYIPLFMVSAWGRRPA